MKTKKLVVIVFALVILLSLCSCTKKENENKSNANFENLSWNENTEKTMKNQEKKELPVASADMFEIEDGVLLRYKGGYDEARKIVLPKKVKRIKRNAFALKKKERNEISKLQTSLLEIPKDVKLEKESFAGAGPLKVTLLDRRKKIEEYAFYNMAKYGCESEVILPDSVETIEQYAFYANGPVSVQLSKNLKRVEKSGLAHATVNELPDSIEYLGDYALGKMSNVADKMPAQLEEMGVHCIVLYGKKLHVPAEVKKIAVNAVLWPENDITDIHGYEVDEQNQYYKSDENGWLYSKDGKILYYAHRLPTEQDLIIPEGVEKVYERGLDLYDRYINTDFEKQPRVIMGEKVKLIKGKEVITDAWDDL